MYRFACLAVLAASLIACSWLAYSRYQRGLPALLDFAAMSGMPSTQPLPVIRPPFYRLPPWPGPWLALNAACGFAFGCWVVARRREPAMALLLAMLGSKSANGAECLSAGRTMQISWVEPHAFLDKFHDGAASAFDQPAKPRE